MAISVVQTSSKQRVASATSLSFNFTSVVAGNTIIVPVLLYKYNVGLIVSDGDGRYTEDILDSNDSVNLVAAVFRLINASAGTHAITINGISSGNYIVACAIEVSGSGFLLLDTNSKSKGSSTTPTSGATKTTEIANELIVGAMVCGANQASITAEVTSPTWTEAVEELSFSNFIPGEADRKIVSSKAAYTANWTLATSTPWAAVIATYAEYGTGGSGGEHSSVF